MEAATLNNRERRNQNH